MNQDVRMPRREIISELICLIYINAVNLNTGITGSFLLSSIWLAIDTCGNKDFLHLLIYFLRCISRNYFIQLQRWIYHGELDESVNEIFISRCLNTSPSFTNQCSKEFFDKSYQVDNEAIPEFLVGCEEEILQCGKYNLVLRAYNAQVCRRLFKTRIHI